MAAREVSNVGRRERIEVRCTAEQKEILQHAAELCGHTLSEFILGNAWRAAEQAIHEHEVIRLSARDSRAFVEALLDPAPPSPRLRKAAEYYAATMGAR